MIFWKQYIFSRGHTKAGSFTSSKNGLKISEILRVIEQLFSSFLFGHIYYRHRREPIPSGLK